ncbi:hypothetical protein HAX54_009302 [Datura stramonium]|uniref:Uncharacterized protein n=1 Tax=Datura stramonium TaxID=4076 RepID=A0ABS8TFY8_DATST|nr:hypothetical protein [Datura stramonium]
MSWVSSMDSQLTHSHKGRSNSVTPVAKGQSKLSKLTFGSFLSARFQPIEENEMKSDSEYQTSTHLEPYGVDPMDSQLAKRCLQFSEVVTKSRRNPDPPGNRSMQQDVSQPLLDSIEITTPSTTFQQPV